MASFTQEKRRLELKTPLGPDVLFLTSFFGREEMSRLFSFQLDVLSENDSVLANEIVGKSVTISERSEEGPPRFFNGFVRRFSAGPKALRGLRSYRLEVVPWLWFLTRKTDCRIFQEMTAVEIIEQIFGELGFSDYETSQIGGSHPKREYCVQYREDSFSFVSRLMEQEGIFYFFTHEDGKHTLVMADQTSAYQDCTESDVPYTGGSLAPNHISSWEHQYEFRPGKWAQTDYNFKTPSNDLMTTSQTVVDLPGTEKYEVYDYPGEYAEKGDGEETVKIRMEEEEAAHNVASGTSSCKTFTPGGKFKLQHESDAEEGGYVITSVEHSADESGGFSPEQPAGDQYANTFTCIPDSIVFRPPRLSPKPKVQGLQTAVVTGPPGEEIWPDEFGRIKVQFFWDREGKKDDNSSCWVRVSQAYAGKGWGSMCIPRIGQEVIVDFLEGDPDRPIVTGRVYNAEQMPPYGLPAGKAVSGLKSESTKGGGGYNEFIMDDTKGNELIQVHGQFDMDTAIENDLREHVLNNRSRDVAVDESISIGNDQSYSIGNNQTGSVGVNKNITVGANHTESIGSNMTINIGSSLTETVAINYAETVGAAMELTVGAAMTQTIGAVYVLAVGSMMSESVGANKTSDVGANLTQKVGSNITESVGGKHSETVGGAYELKASTIKLEAKSRIVLKTGSSSITMTSGGNIVIKGTNIKIKGSAKIVEEAATITSDAKAKNVVKGAMVNVEAKAINTIKGALVKIN